MKVLEESNLIKQLTVMMQLEVAKRFTSKPSTKDYNSLSVVIQYKTQASIALKVPKTVFIPAPNVDSAIVKMDVKESIEYKPNDEQVFFRIVRAAFTQRRKTLSNNLSEVLSISKSDIQEILISLGHSMSVRAENLSVEELIELSNNIKREMF
jgi:16S rRNA (adenine1518-N6/adenine1519-N6)-dimethyltransferase